MKGRKQIDATRPPETRAEEDVFDPKGKSILEIIDEITAKVPTEEWSKAPTDGSINFRHYLYGHAKKGE
jgi:hypothetical protein